MVEVSRMPQPSRARSVAASEQQRSAGVNVFSGQVVFQLSNESAFKRHYAGIADVEPPAPASAAQTEGGLAVWVASTYSVSLSTSCSRTS